jgi:hypothetical protein
MKRKIIIVEDDVDTLFSVTIMRENPGYEVTSLFE